MVVIFKFCLVVSQNFKCLSHRDRVAAMLVLSVSWAIAVASFSHMNEQKRIYDRGTELETVMFPVVERILSKSLGAYNFFTICSILWKIFVTFRIFSPIHFYFK
jgi:hypothetical protein